MLTNVSLAKCTKTHLVTCMKLLVRTRFFFEEMHTGQYTCTPFLRSNWFLS